MLMSPSSEELATVAGTADTGLVASDEFRAVAGAADAGSVSSEPVEVRPVAGGADTGSGSSEPVAGGADAGSLISDEIRALAAGADRVCVSVVFSVSSAPGDDVFRASADFLCSPLRNRRHVSELCSASAVLGPTAGLAPSASLVSTSSCPLMGNPLRIW